MDRGCGLDVLLRELHESTLPECSTSCILHEGILRCTLHEFDWVTQVQYCVGGKVSHIARKVGNELAVHTEYVLSEFDKTTRCTHLECMTIWTFHECIALHGQGADKAL